MPFGIAQAIPNVMERGAFELFKSFFFGNIVITE